MPQPPPVGKIMQKGRPQIVPKLLEFRWVRVSPISIGPIRPNVEFLWNQQLRTLVTHSDNSVFQSERRVKAPKLERCNLGRAWL